MRTQHTPETTLRTPPFVFANEMLTTYADGVKTYWRMWGPLGQPAINAVEMWTRSQQRYLEALEAVVAPPNVSQTPQKVANPLHDSLRELFTGFGVGFKD